jgi:anti-anti-sigma factor
MSRSPIDLRVVALGDEFLVAVRGELDLHTGRLLDELLRTCDGPTTVDLAGVTFCDVAGIRCLVRAVEQGVVVDLAGAPRTVRLVADVVGLTHSPADGPEEPPPGRDR